MLFREDAYRREAPAEVVALTVEGGIVLDQSLFYPTGGGQPGDSGVLTWPGSDGIKIATSVKGQGDQIVLVPAEPRALPQVGQSVVQHLDWDRRLTFMRMHTALHLLSVAVPHAVTGGSIGAERSRLDFDMAEPPEDKAALEDIINFWVEMNAPVRESWITDEELDANPGLVKTLTVKPPRGAGRVRLVQIGTAPDIVDLQPCGGTHVAQTGEIGRIRVGKVEKKGRQNRRIYITLE